MDLNTYLRAQFEMYSRLFRDVSAFFLSADVRNNILVSPGVFACHSCEAKGETVVLMSMKSAKGHDRFRYECSHCGKSSGEWQRSASISYWNWFSKKGADHLVSSPVVDPDRYQARCEKWHRVPSDKAMKLAIEWVAATKWVKQVWSQHRATEDYASLSQEDQVFVDAIGASLDLLRQQASSLAASLGVDVRNDVFSGRLKSADVAMQKDRLLHYPNYAPRLTPGLKSRAEELLGLKK